MSKIDEIRKLAEMAVDQNRAKAFIETYVYKLCDALEVVTKYIEDFLDFKDELPDGKDVLAKIDSILEGK